MAKVKAKKDEFDIITKAQVEKLIDVAGAGANTLRKRMQSAGIALMVLSVKHPKDAVELANTLPERLGKGINFNAFAKWLMIKGGFQLSGDKKGFISHKGEKWMREHIAEARKVQWTDFAPPAEFKGFDFNTALHELLDKAGKMSKKEGKDAELVSIDADMLEVVKQLLEPNGKVKAEGAMALVQRLAA